MRVRFFMLIAGVNMTPSLASFSLAQTIASALFDSSTLPVAEGRSCFPPASCEVQNRVVFSVSFLKSFFDFKKLSGI